MLVYFDVGSFTSGAEPGSYGFRLCAILTLGELNHGPGAGLHLRFLDSTPSLLSYLKPQ